MGGHIEMKFLTVTALALAVSTAAFAQAVDDPAADEVKTRLVASSYKRCLNERTSEAWKKTYAQDEIDNFCGCFAVKINDAVTEEEWKADIAANRWQKNPKLIEVSAYCRNKYLNLPDVTALRKRKW
jgi:hypothetical protein